jgi:hypothetical protein
MNTHFRSLSNVGSMKDRRSRRNEYLVLENSAHNMRIWANQAMIPYRARMAIAGAYNCVFHDDAVSPDPDSSTALTDDAGAIQNARSWPNDHVTAYCGVRRHPGGGCYHWKFTRVSDQHDLLLLGPATDRTFEPD